MLLWFQNKVVVAVVDFDVVVVIVVVVGGVDVVVDEKLFFPLQNICCEDQSKVSCGIFSSNKTDVCVCFCARVCVCACVCLRVCVCVREREIVRSMSQCSYD